MSQARLLQIFLCIGLSLHARSQDKTVIHRNVLWMTVNGTLRIDRHWSIQGDISHRRTDNLRSHDLSLVRIAPTYWFTPRFSAAVAYAHLWSESGGGNFDLILQENRIHEQLLYTIPFGRHQFAQRLRVEQRWREAKLSGTSLSRTYFTQRYRYQPSLNLVISRNRLVPTIVIADEIMLQSGKDVERGLFEQNRIYLALQERLGKQFALEAGYMYTWQKSLNGLVYNSINTLRITLFWIGSLKPEPAAGQPAKEKL